jgi:hypothetical protein
MKKTMFSAAVAAAVLTALAATTTAHAQNLGATVIDNFGCVLLGKDSGLKVNLFTSETTHAVITPSGNSLLQCHFTIPAGAEPNKAIVNKGFFCGTFLGGTTNSESVVTPGGTATLRCEVKG